MAVELRNRGCSLTGATSLVVFMFSQLAPPGLAVDIQHIVDIFTQPEVNIKLIFPFFL